MNDYERSENQLQQSLAANQWFMDYMDRREASDRKNRVYFFTGILVLVVLLVLLVSGVNSLYALFAQGTVIETTRETVQTVDGEDAIINNGEFEQYNDASRKEVNS